MFTEKEISDMTPKINPLITPAKSWDTKLSDDEYNKLAAKYDAWAVEMADYIEETYGQGCGLEFRRLFRIQEDFLIISAGFKLDLNAMTKIIKTSVKDDSQNFLNQSVVKKLLPVKESISLIAFAAQTMRDAKDPAKDNLKPSAIVEVNRKLNAQMKLILPLLAKNSFSLLKPYEKLKLDCEANNKNPEALESEKKLNYLEKLAVGINKKVSSNTADYTSILEN